MGYGLQNLHKLLSQNEVGCIRKDVNMVTYTNLGNSGHVEWYWRRATCFLCQSRKLTIVGIMSTENLERNWLKSS